MATPARHPKAVLQEVAQKRHMGLPKYSHYYRGHGKTLTYKAFVTVGDKTFEGEHFFTHKKDAECNAAVVALKKFNYPVESLSNTGEEEGLKGPLVLYECDGTTNDNPKSNLSKILKKRNLPRVEYLCKGVGHGGGFFCAATFMGKEFKTDEVFRRRIFAENRVANLILESLPKEENDPDAPSTLNAPAQKSSTNDNMSEKQNSGPEKVSTAITSQYQTQVNMPNQMSANISTSLADSQSRSEPPGSAGHYSSFVSPSMSGIQPVPTTSSLTQLQSYTQDQTPTPQVPYPSNQTSTPQESYYPNQTPAPQVPYPSNQTSTPQESYYPNQTPTPQVPYPPNQAQTSQVAYPPNQTPTPQVPYPPNQTSTPQVPYPPNQTQASQVPYPPNQNPAPQVPYSSNQTQTAQVPYSPNQTQTPQVAYPPSQTPTSQVPYPPNQIPASQVPYPPNQTSISQVPYPSSQTPTSQVPYPPNQTPTSQVPYPSNQTPTSQMAYPPSHTPTSQMAYSSSQTPTSQMGYPPSQTLTSQVPYPSSQTPTSQMAYPSSQTPTSQMGYPPSQTPTSQMGYPPSQTPTSQMGYPPSQTPTSQVPYPSNQTPASQMAYSPNQTPTPQMAYHPNQTQRPEMAYALNQTPRPDMSYSPNPRPEMPYSFNQKPNSEKPYSFNQKPNSEKPYSFNQKPNSERPYSHKQTPRPESPYSLNQTPRPELSYSPNQRPRPETPYSLYHTPRREMAYPLNQTPRPPIPHSLNQSSRPQIPHSHNQTPRPNMANTLAKTPRPPIPVQRDVSPPKMGMHPRMPSPSSRQPFKLPSLLDMPFSNKLSSSSQKSGSSFQTPKRSQPEHSRSTPSLLGMKPPARSSTPSKSSQGSKRSDVDAKLIPSSQVSPSDSLNPPAVFLEMSYKSFLQEYLQQRGMKSPHYETRIKGCGYMSSAKFADRIISSEGVFTTKKMAEQMAARRALMAMGMKRPEELAQARKKRFKVKTFPSRPSERSSWLHHHPSSAPKPRKDQFDDSAKLDKELELPPECKKDLSVGEVWHEKKVAIVGDGSCSFMLLCSHKPNSLELFCKRTKKPKTIRPGHCLTGLEAECVKYQGKIALEASQCEDIKTPETPNPVLISCGVAMLYHDKENSSEIQVLLKRYLCSGAFVNVAAELARYLRCHASYRPTLLRLDVITEHIKDWMLQEVEWIASMNEEALRKVFSYMWKFTNRWSEFLQPKNLPFELQKLQAIAKDELARRKANPKKLSEEQYHPWGLPKGNFRHRECSTGLYIESPAECAARELREETGIMLEPFQLDNAPYLDIPQSENFNPHKGDTMRFYLYVYKPDPFAQLIENYQSSQMDSSIQSEQDGSFTASEEVKAASSNAHQDTSENKEHQRQQESGQDALVHPSAVPGSDSTENDHLDVPMPPENNTDEGQLEKPDLEQDGNATKGLKRKRNSEESEEAELSQQENGSSLLTSKETKLDVEQNDQNKSDINYQATSEPLETTSGPVETTSEPLETTSRPLETTSEPLETTSEPLETTSEPLETTSETLEKISEPLETTSQSLETTSQPPETTSQPLETTSQLLETTSQPLETTSQPLETTSQLLETTSQPLETTSQPLETTSQPLETTSQPLETTSELHSKTDQGITVIDKGEKTSPQIPGLSAYQSDDNDEGSGIESSLQVSTGRGQKRKRYSESAEESETPQKKRVSTPGQATPNKQVGGTPGSSVKSPRVQGGVHEECAWFSLEEARKKSPLFDQIFNLPQFKEILASINTNAS